ncbi:hypothetical protein [Arthrobacter sp. FW306-04-A]|uniref:hypothetical protein n=1 Tax=Arthrobacter sp. FW306-04-A TaxID=2879619 RepID=UPI0037C0EB64|nr:hypothetical protein LFT43_19940 [Arthrobacter sp. FW306-04-A]
MAEIERLSEPAALLNPNLVEKSFDSPTAFPDATSSQTAEMAQMTSPITLTADSSDSE